MSDGTNNTRGLREEIRQTRFRMDRTIDELSECFSVSSLLDRGLRFFRSKQRSGDSAGAVLLRRVKNNPLPVLMIGGGLTWLLLSDEEGERVDRRFGKRSDVAYWREDELIVESPPSTREEELAAGRVYVPPAYDDDENSSGGRLERGKERAKEAGKELGEKAKHGVNRIRHAAEEAGSKVRSGARGVANRARSAMEAAREGTHDLSGKARRAGDTVRRRVEQGGRQTRRAFLDAPLVFGAAAAAAGVLIGALLPGSRKEDHLVGETSDELKHRVVERGREVLEQGKESAAAVALAAKETAKEEGLTLERAKEKVAHVASEAKETAKREVRVRQEEHEAEKRGNAPNVPEQRNEQKEGNEQKNEPGHF